MPHLGQYWQIYGEPPVGQILMKYIMSLGNVSVFECERVITRLHHQIPGIKKTAGVDGEGVLQDVSN